MLEWDFYGLNVLLDILGFVKALQTRGWQCVFCSVLLLTVLQQHSSDSADRDTLTYLRSVVNWLESVVSYVVAQMYEDSGLIQETGLSELYKTLGR